MRSISSHFQVLLAIPILTGKSLRLIFYSFMNTHRRARQKVLGKQANDFGKNYLTYEYKLPDFSLISAKIARISVEFDKNCLIFLHPNASGG